MSFLMSSAWCLFATKIASSVCTMMRSSTPNRATWVFADLVNMMLFWLSIFTRGELAALFSVSWLRYLETEIQDPTSSQSNVASMFSTRVAFSMRA